MTGSTKGLLGFLGGPWGAVVSGAAIIMASLADKIFSSGKAADKATESQRLLRMSAVDLTAANRELNAETDKAISNTQLANEQSRIRALEYRNEAAAARETTRALLEKAIVEAESARDADRMDLSGSRISGVETSFADARVRELQAKIKALDGAIAERTRAYNAQQALVTEQRVAERLDATTAANGRYERSLIRLRVELTKGAISQAQFEDRLFAAGKARDRAIAAAQEANKKVRETTPRGDLANFILPTNGRITSGFGGRSAPLPGASRYHQGLDIAAPYGSPVKAPQVGTVKAIGYDAKLGKYVVIDHGAGTTTKFGHLSDNSIVREGQYVGQGDLIGRVGSTGNSTGNHLHYGVYVGGKAVDPRKGQFGVDSIRAAEAAQRDAEKSTRELDTALEGLTQRFDPAAKAAQEYADAIERIKKLEGAGRITSEQADEYRLRAGLAEIEAREKAAKEASERMLEQMGVPKQLKDDFDDVGKQVEDHLIRAGQLGAQSFRDHGIEAAQAIAQVLGGKLGRTLGRVFGVLDGLQTGNFNSVGGSVGGMLTLLNGGSAAPGQMNPLALSIKSALSPLRSTLDSALGSLGTSISSLSSALPAIGAVLTANSIVGDLLGNGQIKNGKLFSLFSPVLTALFGKALKGSATITSVDGEITTSGNSKKRIEAASGLAGNVQNAIAQIAEALGGDLGSFAGSIGVRKKTYVVDPTGQGRTKGAGVQRFKNEADAQAALLRDAIADGAIQGLSAAVQKALSSNSSVEKSVAEALKVREVEDLLGGLGGEMARAFREFEKQAAERVRIAKQYGFDVVEIEKINNEKRLKLEDELLNARIGSLKDLLDDLNFGDLFEGTISDRLAKLRSELAKAEADAAAGVDGAAEKQAQLARDLVNLSREAFGTAGGQYANDLSAARTGAERVIELEAQRQKDAADLAKKTNEQLDEANDQRAEGNSLLRSIDANIKAMLGVGGGSIVDTGLTARSVTLT